MPHIFLVRGSLTTGAWLAEKLKGGNASKSCIFTNFYGAEPRPLLNFNFGDTLNKFHLQNLALLDSKTKKSEINRTFSGSPIPIFAQK